MPTGFLADASNWHTSTTAAPPSNQQLAGYFHLGDADLELVGLGQGLAMIIERLAA